MKIDLKTLLDTELVERFNELSVELGSLCENISTRSYNRLLPHMRAVNDELYHRGKLDALLPGMQNEDLWIQYYSAVHCRSIAPAESLAVIERLAKLYKQGPLAHPGSVAGEAWTSLNILRSGHAVERKRPPRE